MGEVQPNAGIFDAWGDTICETDVGYSYNGYKYVFTSTGASWDNARSKCQANDGELAHIGMKNLESRG